ncbi:hypothetical protein AVEN_239682-1 [Araneus ventricosus]|uniref:Uncharacterized protein n=1 Tax=Araneus ventricosus TaxID=182803 RepID=A0A4Y2CRH8_ARAVE|nr:hypothetical protein AVEN_239682-1 [Araneus ventricosus]
MRYGGFGNQMALMAVLEVEKKPGASPISRDKTCPGTKLIGLFVFGEYRGEVGNNSNIRTSLPLSCPLVLDKVMKFAEERCQAEKKRGYYPETDLCLGFRWRGLCGNYKIGQPFLPDIVSSALQSSTHEFSFEF